MENLQVEYILSVYGSSGRGKSTFLNYLVQGPFNARNNPQFLAKTTAGACTLAVSPPFTANIFSTETTITVYDTPGSFSLDMPLEQWFDLLKSGLPNPFHALIWVLDITQRAQPGDAVLSQAMEKILDNFTMNKVIIVFTHCDIAADGDDGEIDVKKLADEWLELLNSKIKQKVDTANIVLFGKETRGYDNSQFIPTFLKALEDIPREADLGVKNQIDKKAVYEDILNSVDENMARRFQEEQQRITEEYESRLRENENQLRNMGSEIERLRNQPVREIHHYHETVVKKKRCNIF